MSPLKNMFKIMDHGGQPIYHGIIRLLMTLNAVYLVVFDMSKPLDDPAILLDSNGCERVHHWTNLQFILSSILSVYSHSRKVIENIKEKVNLPVILIVGTHKGKLGDTEEERNDKSKKLLKKIDEALIGKPYQKHVHRMFAVENSEATTDKSFDDLKKEINKLMNQLRKIIPLKWMRFRCEIYNLRVEKLICTLEEVKVLARKSGILDENQQSALLNFLYDLGDIIYMPDNESLKDEVVVDPMGLVKVITAFVTVIPPDLPTGRYREAFSNLNKGILDETLLRKLWEEQCIDMEKFQYLVELMIRFGFICRKITSTSQVTATDSVDVKQSFFVPLRLSFDTPSNEVRSVRDDNQAISIYYDLCGYLPDVVFPYLVIEFINKYRKKNGDDPVLTHDLAELYFDQFHHVTLSLVKFLTKKNERKFLLKVTVTRRKAIRKTISTVCEPSSEACKEVLSTIEMSFGHSKDGGRRGITFHRCIPCDCSETSEKKHMQILGDFQDDMLPCNREGMDVSRYNRLFGDTPSDDPQATDAGLTSRKLTGGELADLTNNLCGEWEELGLRLGFTKANIYTFKQDNPNNIQGAMQSMLEVWQSYEKSKRSHLIEALKHTGRTDLADQFETEP
ncbi:probable serine/threonine-protein kinase pats1 [Antedon mediterranea]|uniref:probable serine/threonine-protein kinase pats1 n=1 Tax=Antedon mediterranea TaxID=105859 RepID=UPI003AF61C97